MRPDWQRAPAWANYAAQEMSGSWYWHAERPCFVELCGEWRSNGQT